MSATISYPENRPHTDKTGGRPIFLTPLPVTLSGKIRFLSLREAIHGKAEKKAARWLKNLGMAFTGLFVAGALTFAGRQAQTATTWSAMNELAAARVNPGDLQGATAALAQAAEQDVAVRQQRLENLLSAEYLTGWQSVSFSVAQYMSYGPMCRQEAIAFERQQLAAAQDALDRFETASTRHATRATRDLAQN